MKKLFLVLGVLVVLAACAMVGLKLYVTSRFSAERLVERIEAARNCRVHIGSTSVALFQKPACLILEDVIILERDVEAENATPLGQRTRPDLEKTGISCPRALLEIQLTDLIGSRLNVDSIILQEAVVRTVVSKSGDSSLNLLFEEIGQETAGVESRVTELWASASVLGEGEHFVKTVDGREKVSLERFNAQDIPIPARLDRVAIEEGRFECLLEKTGAVLRLEEFSLTVSGIDIDPGDLANHNSAHLKLDTRLTVESEGTQYVDLGLATDGVVTPFEVATGYLNPQMIYTFYLKEGSWVEGLPMMRKLGEAMDEVGNIGNTVRRLGERQVLEKEVAVKIAFFDGRASLSEAVSLAFQDFAFTLQQNSWIQTSEGRHEFRANLLASVEVTLEVLEGVDALLKKQAGEGIAQLARGIILEPMLVEGKLSLDFKSKGKFSKPKIRIENPLVDFGSALEKAVKKEGLGGLLKGLFGK